MKKILTLFTAMLMIAMLMTGCSETNPNAMPDGNGADLSDGTGMMDGV